MGAGEGNIYAWWSVLHRVTLGVELPGHGQAPSPSFPPSSPPFFMAQASRWS